MTQDEFDRAITDAAKSYNEPPETPGEEMWRAIRAELDRDRRGDRGDVIEITRRKAARDRRAGFRRWSPRGLGIAVAATLVVGFGLGRITGDRGSAPPAPEARVAPDRASFPVRLAAADHLSEAEALLTMYRADGAAVDRAATSRWARELLMNTRLLLDSRAGDDPRMAALLGDLELVLVQIVHAGASNEVEQEMIEDGIQERQLLAKLRSASATPPRTEM